MRRTASIASRARGNRRMCHLTQDGWRRRGVEARRGFTFLELLVVMTIIGILIALTMPAIGRARMSAKRIECKNNLRNIALALMEFDGANGRLPASGSYFDENGVGATHHTWAVSILPWVAQRALYDAWDFDKPITDPVNEPLTHSFVPVFVCPMDITRSPPPNRGRDLSYAVNGGVGFTIRTSGGVGDCPVSAFGGMLDLNGDGQTCPADPAADGQPSDRTYFKYMGVFFLENWKSGPTGTLRHHALADIKDGHSQTFLVTENARTGYNPDDATATFANPNPYLCAFYIGSPCRNGSCAAGNVDYSQCNAGAARINSGLKNAEGTSPVPNSFHDGGVNMAFADGHVNFLSEQINGAVYAALASPLGLRLQKTPLEQTIASDDSF
jgi:prepilin-type N-terminal cleavage/methylation domain-containing protein/prepilin-type processing-associated H-X9-DG protein